MREETMLARLWRGVGGPATAAVSFTGSGSLPSAFAVTEFAAASVGVAGAAVAELAQRLNAAAAGEPGPGSVQVDRGLASLWFGQSFRPVGWELPPAWDAIAGDYECADSWIRLHTNAPHHRLAALGVLGQDAATASRESVAAEVAAWAGAELESAVVAAGGCAAQMRSASQWAMHSQGAAVAAEPLLHWRLTGSVRREGSPDMTGEKGERSVLGAPGDGPDGSPGARSKQGSSGAAQVRAPAAGTADRPLAGVRVLDLTRVLAGPVATRFLAGYGAEVLRIDPPDWAEPALEPEMTLGKNCARLDLKTPEGLQRLKELLAGADILVHGYRPSALERLGLGDDVLAAQYPSLVNVALDAYGWTGPWADRRGFDSLVQMSCGIADAGMRHYDSPRPHPLPVQALDHATGYLLAAATVLAWTRRLDGEVWAVRGSLARTALELMSVSGEPGVGGVGGDGKAAAADGGTSAPPSAADYRGVPENTPWGPGERLPMPVTVSGVPVSWDVPARGYGSAPARWK